jgi:hypothetical protein
MNDDDANLQRADPARPTTSVPALAASPADAENPRVRRMLTKKRRRSIVATAMLVPIIGLSVGLLASPAASAAQPASGVHAAGLPGSAGGGSNHGTPKDEPGI